MKKVRSALGSNSSLVIRLLFLLLTLPPLCLIGFRPTSAGETVDLASVTPMPEPDPPDPVASAEGVSLLEREAQLRAAGAVELRGARSAYGRQYALPNGRRATLISAVPIHYQTPDGAYELLDNALVPTADQDGYAFTNAANSFSVYFPGDAGYTTDLLLRSQTETEVRLWGEGEVWYEDTGEGRQRLDRSGPSAGTPQGNAIRYPGRYPGVAEVFTVRSDGVKHTYEIDQFPSFLGDRTGGSLEFREVIVLPAGARLSVDGTPQHHDFVTDGDIRLVDAEGNFLGVFPAPWAH